MKYVSLFSGIEAATVAWEPLGWEPLAFSEIDAFPCAVLAERFPCVPNLWDITKIAWKKAVKAYGKPDLVVGGSPCQSFSISGGRTGLEGASGLMWEYVRAVRDVKPRWLLWENVPGALSSTHGEDFRGLLEALDACGYGLAWRVLDAQFFGVAQRRERLFLVGRLGDVEGPCEVLFEPESLSWDSGSSKEKRKALAAGDEGGARAAGFKFHQGSGAGSIGYEDEVSPTLIADWHNHAVLQVAGNVIGRKPENGGYQVGIRDPEIDGAFTLTSTDRHAVIAPTAKTLQVRCGKEGGGKGALVQDDLSATLSTSNAQTLFKPVAFAANQRGEARLQGGDGSICGSIPASQSGKQVQGVVCQYGDVAGALTASGSSPSADRGPSIVADGPRVRRLTPRECERLQGLPDDWTLVPYRGKPADECPDGPRYKAIGNSMAVPVMRWIGERIEAAERGEL